MRYIPTYLVYLGIGGFNLMLSILPAKLLRVFEFIGFSGIFSTLILGNREFGMKCLALGADWAIDELQSPIKTEVPKPSKNVAIDFFSDVIKKEEGLGSRKFMCDIMLHQYHVLFSSMIQLPACNIPLATKMIDQSISEHPDSFLYLLIRAKISQSERSLERGIDELDKVISVQKDWRQLAHLCFWDLGISNAALGNYEKAAEYFDILYKENEWSKSIYLYFRAVLLYAADEVKHKATISDLMKKIPDHLKKVAGKSVPLEVTARLRLEICSEKSSKIFSPKRKALISSTRAYLYVEWIRFDSRFEIIRFTTKAGSRIIGP